MSTTQKQLFLNRGASRKRIPLRTACATRLLPLALLLTLPAVVQAQYIYTTNSGTITISGYTGTDTVVSVPSSVYGLPVTGIGDHAFQYNSNLTSVTISNGVISIGDSAFSECSSLTTLTIPNSVTNIGDSAFSACTSLTSITIPNSVTSLKDYTFHFCTSLTSVNIPNGVTSIGSSAFSFCTSLSSITIPNSVTSIANSAFAACINLTYITIPASATNIEDYAFSSCVGLIGIYFQGNAPSLGLDVFANDDNATVYYLAGTTGWGTTFGGRPTAVWNSQPQPRITNVGVRTNQFGFTIIGISSQVIVVEACTNLTNPFWSPLQTNTLSSGSLYFSDPRWTNYPGRCYRLRSP